MQSLSPTTDSVTLSDCAAQTLKAAPTLLWYIRRHMRKHRQGLSVPQFVALVKIRKDPAISLSTVAEHLGASLPTASRVIATLIDKGYLTRASCTDDRRQCRLSLTPRGLKIVDTACGATQAHMERELASLSEADRRNVYHTMRLLDTLFEPLLRTSDAPADIASEDAPPTPRPRPRVRRTPARGSV